MAGVFSFDEGLRKGIHPNTAESPKNTPLLNSCQGLKPTPYGLRQYYNVNQPVSDAVLAAATPTIAKSWPLPQLFRGKEITILCHDKYVYKVTEAGSGSWTLAAIKTYTMADWSTAYSGTDDYLLPTGGAWNFVDLGTAFIIGNGACLAFYNVFGSGTSKLIVATSPLVKTCCSHKDSRIIYGNWTTQRTAAWRTQIQSWLSNSEIPDDLYHKVYDNLATGADGNWVWCSSVGGDDMLFHWRLDIALYGSTESSPTTGYSSTNPLYIDLLNRNQAGFYPMPYRGDVQTVKPLGDLVMCYGADGIAALAPVDTMYSTLDIPSIGRGVGVGTGRCLVGGDENVHLFIDQESNAWLITPDLQTTKLEYKNELSGLTKAYTVISYDNVRQEFYICDKITDKSYMYSLRGGFSRCPYLPTNVFFASANTGGTGATAEAQSILNTFTTATYGTNVVVDSGMVDFSEVGIHELYRIDVETDDTTTNGMQYAVYYKNKKADSYTLTSADYLDKRGVAFPCVSGLVFVIRLTADDRTKVNISKFDAVFRNVTDGTYNTRNLL